MGDKKSTLDQVKKKIREFVRERDWEQFHSPKNISMSIAVEAAELMEHFQWLTEEQSRDLLKDKNKREEIEDELADIAIFILDFCNLFNIEFEEIIKTKLKKTAGKYPAHLVKGKTHKYTYYKDVEKS